MLFSMHKCQEQKNPQVDELKTRVYKIYKGKIMVAIVKLGKYDCVFCFISVKYDVT